MVTGHAYHTRAEHAHGTLGTKQGRIQDFKGEDGIVFDAENVCFQLIEIFLQGIGITLFLCEGCIS